MATYNREVENIPLSVIPLSIALVGYVVIWDLCFAMCTHNSHHIITKGHIITCRKTFVATIKVIMSQAI